MSLSLEEMYIHFRRIYDNLPTRERMFELYQQVVATVQDNDEIHDLLDDNVHLLAVLLTGVMYSTA
jgi:hypothetical protein